MRFPQARSLLGHSFLFDSSPEIRASMERLSDVQLFMIIVAILLLVWGIAILVAP